MQKINFSQNLHRFQASCSLVIQHICRFLNPFNRNAFEVNSSGLENQPPLQLFLPFSWKYDYRFLYLRLGSPCQTGSLKQTKAQANETNTNRTNFANPTLFHLLHPNLMRYPREINRPHQN